jgi:segregation and condensation protein B
MYGTTRTFLDYFNLKSLDQLPPLPEIRQLIEPLIVAESEARDGVPPEPMEGSGPGGEFAGEGAQEADAAGDESAENVGVGVGQKAREEPSSEPDETERSAGVQTAEVVKLPTAQH